MVYFSIALRNTEVDILKADPNDLKETDKKETRKLHHNPVLEKFYAGQTDEKYTKDYYEVLKKADAFMKKASPRKIATTADKYHMSYGQDKDAWGRRYEHFGFFDDKHKHAGKTLGEVLAIETEARRTKDDDYELVYIFNNHPIEVGLADIMSVVEKSGNKIIEPAESCLDEDVESDEYQVMDIANKSKSFKFPIKVQRDNNDVVNKIEQLSEFLHVKKIGFEYRQLEFFIPLKFKTDELDENSEIFKEIINIKSIFVRNDYGELMGFGIIEFKKRIKHNDAYDVLKFQGIEMETVSVK
jgi:hypothetical protein